MDETWSHPGVQRQMSAIDGDGLFAVTDLPAGLYYLRALDSAGQLLGSQRVLLAP